MVRTDWNNFGARHVLPLFLQTLLNEIDLNFSSTSTKYKPSLESVLLPYHRYPMALIGTT